MNPSAKWKLGIEKLYIKRHSRSSMFRSTQCDLIGSQLASPSFDTFFPFPTSSLSLRAFPPFHFSLSLRSESKRPQQFTSFNIQQEDNHLLSEESYDD